MSGERVVNFTFHGIGRPGRAVDSAEESYWIGEDAFEEILDAVTGRDDVTLTFDDGNLSDLTVALPRLAARGMKASFFFAPALLGTEGHLHPSQARAIAESGMTVGSHGMDHRSWIGLSPRDLDREIDEARDRLEQLVGRPVTQAACPLGTYDRRSLARLRACGFERVYTSDRGSAQRGDWIQPRNTLVRDDRGEEVKRILGELPGALARAARAARLASKRWR